jgi:hypothetical protein
MNARVSLLYLMDRLVFHEASCVAFAVENFTYNRLYRETSHFRVLCKKLASILGGEKGCAGASYMWLLS